MSPILNLTKKSALVCFKALASSTRLVIHDELLRGKKMSISQLARELNISQPFATKQINILEKAGLVQSTSHAGIRGVKKICRSVYDEIVYRPVQPKAISGKVTKQFDIPIGTYTLFNVFPSCGLVNEHKTIGILDDPQSFYDPSHASAQLLWFARGWVEYHLPRKHPRNAILAEMQIVMEISSENKQPVGENECPSDISLWINEKKIGTWHSWGFYTNTHGRYTPDWWPIHNNQFGLLKEWKIDNEGAYIDGEKISSVTISDLELNKKTFITLRLGIDEQDEHMGGMCLFGKQFGNYPQDILVNISYKSRRY